MCVCGVHRQGGGLPEPGVSDVGPLPYQTPRGGRDRPSAAPGRPKAPVQRGSASGFRRAASNGQIGVNRVMQFIAEGRDHVALPVPYLHRTTPAVAAAVRTHNLPRSS